jgi:hypothetical protein
MVVRTFGETWDVIETLLQANSAVIGVPIDSIVKGDIEVELRAPFLEIYLNPFAGIKSERGVSGHKARCDVFAGVVPHTSLANSLKDAVDMAGRVLRVMTEQTEINAFPLDSPIEFDQQASDFTLVSVSFIVPFRF